MKLNDDARRVLQVIAHGRSNRHHICQQSGLAEADATEHLATLTGAGLVTEVDRDLFAITSDGLDELNREYPTEAGFLREISVIHDAPTIKTLRLRGDRGLVEVQVDEQSVLKLAGALRTVLADTHSTHDAVAALEGLLGSDMDEETADEA
jgi:DNA-binding transcriptional ArsR family regulator